MKVYDRRRAIIETLCLRKHDIGRNFAFEFGASVRTIYYDVNALTPYYPIYTKSGKGGGTFIANGYKLDRLYLTDEQSALLEELLPTLTESKAVIMQSILDTFQLKNRKKT